MVVFLKQVVVSLTDKGDERLRRLAIEIKGGKKGSLSETVEEALELLEKKIKQLAAMKRLKEISDKGVFLGVGKFEREDAYK